MSDADVRREDLVLEQKYRLYDAILSSNNNLHARADSLIQTGGILAGFAALATSLLSLDRLPLAISSTANSDWRPWFLVLLSLAVFIVLVILKTALFRSTAYRVSGRQDWDSTHQLYLQSDSGYEQLLSDILDAISSVEQVNAVLARRYLILTYVLLAQAVLMGAPIMSFALALWTP